MTKINYLPIGTKVFINNKKYMAVNCNCDDCKLLRIIVKEKLIGEIVEIDAGNKSYSISFKNYPELARKFPLSIAEDLRVFHASVSYVKNGLEKALEYAAEI